MALDIAFEDEEAISTSLDSVVSEMLGTDGTLHGIGTVNSFVFMADDAKSVYHCDSGYRPEQEALASYVRTGLVSAGLNMAVPVDYSRMGQFMITISPLNVDDDDLYNKAYEQMHRGLRKVLAAWARHRNRFLLASFHQCQFDGPDVLQDHVHVLYGRYDTDTRNMCTEELYRLCDNHCSWDSIDIALGGIPLPDYAEDEDVYTDEVFGDSEFVDAATKREE